MRSLDDWLAFAPALDAVYLEELGRSAFSDSEAFVNWTYHWREFDHDLTWIRDQVRDSAEWRERHGGPADTPPPADHPPALDADAPLAPSGGLRERATDTTVRPRLSRADIARLLPERGGFTFPAPYGTRAVRLTNASDCDDQDGVLPCGYAYWSQINNHRGEDSLLAFVGLERRLGGRGPTLYRVEKRNLRVEKLGPLFELSHPLSWAEGQGWYFSGTRPTVIYLNDGPRLVRYDVLARTFETVFMVNDADHLWQCHSSADDRVHSATVKDANDQDLGCVVYRDGRQSFFPIIGVELDECQVDASGRWLVIKEKFERGGRKRDDNRIIDLETGAERDLRDEEGAAGHSDMGAGTIVGENDFSPLPGALCQIDLATSLELLEYHATAWGPGMGHVSVRSGRALVSHASREQLPRVNELVLVPLDGSLRCTVVAPNLTDLSGVPVEEEYKWLPHANMDPLGAFAMWTANAHGRRDAFLVELPAAG